jgi:hypothetical protein
LIASKRLLLPLLKEWKNGTTTASKSRRRKISALHHPSTARRRASNKPHPPESAQRWGVQALLRWRRLQSESGRRKRSQRCNSPIGKRHQCPHDVRRREVVGTRKSSSFYYLSRQLAWQGPRVPRVID